MLSRRKLSARFTVSTIPPINCPPLSMRACASLPRLSARLALSRTALAYFASRASRA